MTRIAPTTATPHPQGPTRSHEHAWITESRHQTSQGLIVYVRCARCGALRVDLQDRPDTPPSAVSTVICTQARRAYRTDAVSRSAR